MPRRMISISASGFSGGTTGFHSADQKRVGG
jgi:hypothetical protein